MITFPIKERDGVIDLDATFRAIIRVCEPGDWRILWLPDSVPVSIRSAMSRYLESNLDCLISMTTTEENSVCISSRMPDYG